MFKKIMIGILICSLQACASARIPQELQKGKMSFASGDYKAAFRELMPLASEGSVEAEYAVGYMYYYGYGVTRDTQSGMFWMQKAADKHNKQAIKALSMIH
ncbi:MAG: sel1 repeat family protein [Gammaproteobacteria bacterium]|nr:sel1 repeat family protein [Gammaproteobacteria bacterium]